MSRFSWIALTAAMFVGSAARAQTSGGSVTPVPPPLVAGPPAVVPAIPVVVAAPASSRLPLASIDASLEMLCRPVKNPPANLKNLCDAFAARRAAIATAAAPHPAARLPPGTIAPTASTSAG